MCVYVLKVLNGKVAEEMDIVENHLTGLAGIYYFYKVVPVEIIISCDKT